MRRRRAVVHLAWRGTGVLCDQRFPKPQRTKHGSQVTCCSCTRVADHKLRSTHKNDQPTREELAKALGVEC